MINKRISTKPGLKLTTSKATFFAKDGTARGSEKDEHFDESEKGLKRKKKGGETNQSVAVERDSLAVSAWLGPLRHRMLRIRSAGEQSFVLGRIRQHHNQCRQNTLQIYEWEIQKEIRPIQKLFFPFCAAARPLLKPFTLICKQTSIFCWRVTADRF